MFESDSYAQALVDVLRILKNDLNHLVIVGGWCPYLYAKCLWKIPFGSFPRTTDIDIGITETGSKRYSPTLFERLINAGYATERFYKDEKLPVEIIYNRGKVQMKIEFITSFEVSDDTLQRFLGSQVACHRIEAFDILLRSDLLRIPIEVDGKNLLVKIVSPATFLFHKGITFVSRSNKEKRDKDLYYVFHILRSCPNLEDLLEKVKEFRNNEYFHAFRKNILKHVGTNRGAGYVALKKHVATLVEPKKVDLEIETVFRPLIQVLKTG
ncbi:MAG: hypothetical protein HYT97_06360 [Elusimicrobia bacterium]|nr:hypothetical protein [Elusimicrobiota bacterium]